MSVSEAASSGDRLAALEAVRDRIARELDETAAARDVASLQKGLRETLAEIDELRGAEAEGPVTALDELVARRANRKAG